MTVLERILASRGLERLPFKVANHPRLHTREVGWELMRRAMEARPGPVTVLKAQAEAAQVVAEKVGDRELRLLARAEVANAYRIRGELSTAHEILKREVLPFTQTVGREESSEIHALYGTLLADFFLDTEAILVLLHFVWMAGVRIGCVCALFEFG